MIIFLSSFEIILPFILLLTAIFGAANALVSMINVFIVLFIIKNFIQDIVIGFFKNHNSIITSIWYLIVDSIRMWLFFTLIKECGLNYANSGGLSMFFDLIGFLGCFLIGGFIYVLGEMLSLAHCQNK